MAIDHCTPNDLPDAAVQTRIPCAPCSPLGVILTYEDPLLARLFMNQIKSPLPIQLEEDYDENDEEIREEALPEGVSFESVMAEIEREAASNRDDKLARIAREIQNMDKLFDSVRSKMGEEEFALFLALFSLESRVGGAKGKWALDINGKLEEFNDAVFSVKYVEQNTLTSVTNIASGMGSVENVAVLYDTAGNDGDKRLINPTNVYLKSFPDNPNVYSVGSKVFGNDFEIVVSPNVELYSEINTYAAFFAQSQSEKIGVKQRSIDDLANDLIAEIKATVASNNYVDWWVSKTLTAFEIVMTVAVICTGVGAVVAGGAKVARAAQVGLILLESSNLVESSTRFFGVNKTGYNPLLEAAKALDEKTGTKGLEFTFHALNMLIAFGKKPVTKTLTGFTSATAGGFFMTDGVLEQQTIKSYESPVPQK